MTCDGARESLRSGLRFFFVCLVHLNCTSDDVRVRAFQIKHKPVENSHTQESHMRALLCGPYMSTILDDSCLWDAWLTKKPVTTHRGAQSQDKEDGQGTSWRRSGATN